MHPYSRILFLVQQSHGYLHPTLWGCIPMVVLHFWSRIPLSHGYLHPMLWGCVPIVVFHSWSTVSWVPTPYTVGMHPCGHISSRIHGHLHPMLRGCIPMVVFFILDSVVSLGTYTHLVCLIQHHCRFCSKLFWFSFFVSALILDSWALPPAISSTHHFQGHLHPTLWGHPHNCHPFLLHSWLVPTPTNPGLEPPNHHHRQQPLRPQPAD